MLQRVYVRPAARLVSAVRQRVARQSAPYQDCPNRGLAIKRRAVGHLFPSALPGAAVATADVYKSESPAWGEAGLSSGEAEGGDRTLHELVDGAPAKVQQIRARAQIRAPALLASWWGP